MDIQSTWLTRGYFDLSNEAQPTTTQIIRDELCTSLGITPGGLQIANYPVGPSWKHTYWWREGKRDYAEAQYFMQIAQSYPVLSLGLSVEKGFEDDAASKANPQTLDRGSWDWPRLVAQSAAILEQDIPIVAGRLSQPLYFRFRVHDRKRRGVEHRAFGLENGTWFERREGSSDSASIGRLISDIDKRQDRWAIVHFAVDLYPSLIDGMSASDLTKLLITFEPIRKKLRES
jgi:hypothetical protein